MNFREAKFNGSEVRDLPESPADQAAGEEHRATADGEGAPVPLRESGPGVVRAEEAPLRLLSGHPQAPRNQVVQAR